ncbi:MAG: hypothetical protein D6798_06315, partial [Deltaproteobacteria bacterium]
MDSLDAADESAARAWARLAVVRRTLEWYRVDDDRLRHARYVGTNCRRLLFQAAELGDLGPLPGRLDGLLTALDAAEDVEGRSAVLVEACAVIDALLPLSTAGTTLLPVEPQARLIIPRRRRRRAARPDATADAPGGVDATVAGPAPTPDGDQDGEPVAAAPPGESVDTGAGATPAMPATEGGAGAGPENDDSAPASAAPADGADAAGAGPVADVQAGDETDAEAAAARIEAELAALFAEARQAAARPPRREGPAASPDRQRLPYHHEERGGRPRSDLEGVDPAVVEALRAQGVVT